MMRSGARIDRPHARRSGRGRAHRRARTRRRAGSGSTPSSCRRAATARCCASCRSSPTTRRADGTGKRIGLFDTLDDARRDAARGGARGPGDRDRAPCRAPGRRAAAAHLENRGRRTSSTRRSPRASPARARRRATATCSAACLRLHVAKSASYTRWDVRPLTAEQLAYAREDVLHLMELSDALHARLEAKGRLEWAREECRRLEGASDERDPETAFERLPRAASLDPRSRAVARELAAWRERTASAEDKPVGTILPDPALVEIAKRKPAQPADLEQIRGLHGGHLKRRGAELVAAVERGRAAEPIPREARGPGSEPGDAPLVALVESVIRARAIEAGLAYELIASRAELERIVIAARRGDREPDVRALARLAPRARRRRAGRAARRTARGDDRARPPRGARRRRRGGRGLTDAGAAPGHVHVRRKASIPNLMIPDFGMVPPGSGNSYVPCCREFGWQVNRRRARAVALARTVARRRVAGRGKARCHERAGWREAAPPVGAGRACAERRRRPLGDGDRARPRLRAAAAGGAAPLAARRLRRRARVASVADGRRGPDHAPPAPLAAAARRPRADRAGPRARRGDRRARALGAAHAVVAPARGRVGRRRRLLPARPAAAARRRERRRPAGADDPRLRPTTAPSTTRSCASTAAPASSAATRRTPTPA